MKKHQQSKGQSLVEYAFIIALIAIASIAALQVISAAGTGIFAGINGTLAGV